MTLDWSTIQDCKNKKQKKDCIVDWSPIQDGIIDWSPIQDYTVDWSTKQDDTVDRWSTIQDDIVDWSPILDGIVDWSPRLLTSFYRWLCWASDLYTQTSHDAGRTLAAQYTFVQIDQSAYESLRLMLSCNVP